MTISASELRRQLLEPGMEFYLRAKLPDLPLRELDARIEETLRFLYLSSECGGDIPVTREIDDVWHLLILQTAEYERLCRRLPAGGDGRSVGDRLTNEVRMLAMYVENFGPFDSDRVRYWRLAAYLMRELGWTTDDLNHWLIQSGAQTTAA